jgi:hypothetical protein
VNEFKSGKNIANLVPYDEFDFNSLAVMAGKLVTKFSTTLEKGGIGRRSDLLSSELLKAFKIILYNEILTFEKKYVFQSMELYSSCFLLYPRIYFNEEYYNRLLLLEKESIEYNVLKDSAFLDCIDYFQQEITELETLSSFVNFCYNTDLNYKNIFERIERQF